MDAKAVDLRIETAVKAERDRAAALRDAERDVRPLIGDIQVAMDSADSVYEYALKNQGVDIADVPASAYRAVWRMHVKQAGQTQRHAPIENVVAMDAAERKTFDERFPTFNRLKRA